MSENLYAPPQAELGSGAERATGTGDFDLGRCLSDAWTHTWRNFPLWLGAGIVFLLACLVSVLFIVPILLVIPVLYEVVDDLIQKCTPRRWRKPAQEQTA